MAARALNRQETAPNGCRLETFMANDDEIDFNFDPRYWFWLFKGQARAEFDRMSEEEQRNVVRAALRFNAPAWLQDIVEEERAHRQMGARHWSGKDWDRQVYKLPYVSERCTIIVSKQYIPVPVGL